MASNYKFDDKVRYDGDEYTIGKDYGKDVYRIVNDKCFIDLVCGRDLERAMYQVYVDDTPMVSGPGHLTEAESAEWVAIYRKINPDLPADAIRTENLYR